ncbi:MAG: hypothetical protein ACK504_10235 [Bacteroidota bacterium]
MILWTNGYWTWQNLISFLKVI